MTVRQQISILVQECTHDLCDEINSQSTLVKDESNECYITITKLLLQLVMDCNELE